MRELNKMELEIVSGGLCSDDTARECIAGVGDQVIQEINSFISGLNDMGSRLGSWWYKFVNC